MLACWSALASAGWLEMALAGSGKLCLALAGPGWFWLALAGSGLLWQAMASLRVHWVIIKLALGLAALDFSKVVDLAFEGKQNSYISQVMFFIKELEGCRNSVL